MSGKTTTRRTEIGRVVSDKMQKAATVLARTGNTSSASVPLALADALDAGRVADGDLILFVGFGAGMTAASSVIRWSPPANLTGEASDG